MGPGTTLGLSISGFPKVGQPTPAEIEEGWRSVSRKKMGRTLSCLLSWAGREEALSGSWDGACTGKSPEVTGKAVARSDEMASDLDRGLGMWATVRPTPAALWGGPLCLRGLRCSVLPSGAVASINDSAKLSISSQLIY